MARQITEGEVIALAATFGGGSGGGGAGEGDMKKSVYDPDLVVRDAGGIEEFVKAKLTPDNDGYINI